MTVKNMDKIMPGNNKKTHQVKKILQFVKKTDIPGVV